MKYLNTLKGLLLTLLLACTSTVFAHDFEENGIYYNILSETDKTVEVTYKGDNAGSFNEYIGVVVIPSTIDVNDITYSVNRIGVFAFKGCKDLKSITIPGSVMEICNSAFDDCTGMQELYLEDCDDPIMCKKEYDSQTVYFFEDSPIESMYIGRDIINYSFSYGVMQWSKSLKSVVIGYGMTYINNNIFERCYNLASVAISNNVKHIGNDAFRSCKGLVEIKLPKELISIGTTAFSSCVQLKSIMIPSNVTSIGRNAFKATLELERIIVESDNEVYDSRDNCNAIIETETNTLIKGCKNTIVPNSITNIGNNAFNECTNLKSIILPNKVTHIGDYAFWMCNELCDIKLNSNPIIGLNAIPANVICHLVLIDSNYANFNANNANTYTDVSYMRTISEGRFGTIILPFTPNAKSLENYAFYALAESGNGYMRFEEVATPVANTPYIYTLREGKENVAMTGGVTTISSNIVTPEVDGWQTVGSFTNQALDTSNGNYYAFSPSKNEINKITKNLTVLPYRAYFKSDNASKSAFSVYISGTTGVKEVLSSEIDGFETEVVYDLSGRKILDPVKGGIYIINGKKVKF